MIWICGNCRNHNPGNKNRCLKCGSTKEDRTIKIHGPATTEMKNKEEE